MYANTLRGLDFFASVTLPFLNGLHILIFSTIS